MKIQGKNTMKLLQKIEEKAIMYERAKKMFQVFTLMLVIITISILDDFFLFFLCVFSKEKKNNMMESINRKQKHIE